MNNLTKSIKKNLSKDIKTRRKIFVVHQKLFYILGASLLFSQTALYIQDPDSLGLAKELYSLQCYM